MAEYDRKKYTISDRDWVAYPPRNMIEKWMKWSVQIFVQPMRYLKTEIIQPRQQTYYWYHRKYPRVATIDQCYDHDVLCHYEAEEQLRRDKKVDDVILALLHERFDDCMFYEGQENQDRCRNIWNTMKETETNWFIKYGDIGGGPFYARKIFMKQKHRLLWERRHGPVGTGKKMRHYHPDGTPYYK